MMRQKLGSAGIVGILALFVFWVFWVRNWERNPAGREIGSNQQPSAGVDRAATEVRSKKMRSLDVEEKNFVTRPISDIVKLSAMRSRLSDFADSVLGDQTETVLEPHVKHFFTDASVVERVSFVKQKGVFPPLVIKDAIIRDNSGVENDVVVRSKVSVADEVVVKLSFRATMEQLDLFLSEHGLEIRSKGNYSGRQNELQNGGQEPRSSLFGEPSMAAFNALKRLFFCLRIVDR
jgi:hypothetical protein